MPSFCTFIKPRTSIITNTIGLNIVKKKSINFVDTPGATAPTYLPTYLDHNIEINISTFLNEKCNTLLEADDDKCTMCNGKGNCSQRAICTYSEIEENDVQIEYPKNYNKLLL